MEFLDSFTTLCLLSALFSAELFTDEKLEIMVAEYSIVIDDSERGFDLEYRGELLPDDP